MMELTGIIGNKKIIMKFNYKTIHIGSLIKDRSEELNIESSRICNFLKCTEREILNMYEQENMDTYMLLRWSKLLDYDFFRIYSQHILLYSPQQQEIKKAESQISKLPIFRKNIYTKDLIEYILEALTSGKKTKQEIIDDYRIPKTTLYKWIAKHQK